MKRQRLIFALAVTLLPIDSSAGMLDFLSEIFGDNSPGHNTPQELEVVAHSPDRPPIALGSYTLNGGVFVGFEVEPNNPQKVDLRNNSDIQDCKTVTSSRRLVPMGTLTETALFIPTRSAAEWSSFKTNVDKIGQVSIRNCERVAIYQLPGACRHIQNVNYDNRSQRPEYLMSCTRSFSLAGLPDAPGPGEKIGKISIIAQIGSRPFGVRGNILATSGSNTLCGTSTTSESIDFGDSAINTSVQSGITRTTTTYTPGTNPSFHVNRHLENNSKYDQREFRYNGTTQTVSVTHSMNGWGDCRLETCATCIGDITVQVEIE